MSEHKVYEFIEGGEAGTDPWPHGAGFMPNDQDASSFGRIFGQLHSAPDEWYKPFEDKPKCQWEEHFTGIETDGEAAKLRAEFGDIASQVCLFTRRAPECFRTAAMETSRLLHMQLESGSLLGRLVVGHGDAHGKNLMHRHNGGHGDLVLIDLDLVGRYPAALDLGTTLACSKPGAMPYPTVDQRKLVAQAYLSEVGAVVEQYSRATVEDMLFDMEIGSLLRDIWTAVVIPLIFVNEEEGEESFSAPWHKQFMWQHLWLCRSGLNLVEAAKTGEPYKLDSICRLCHWTVVTLLCAQMPL